MDNVTGKRIFHDIIINISYRKRQYVIRIQIKKKLKNNLINKIKKRFTGMNHIQKI